MLIYTIGKRSIYGQALRENPTVSKLAGGSVWKTLDEALTYWANLPDSSEWRVYGVLASWDEDVRERSDCGWGDLTRDATIVDCLSAELENESWRVLVEKLRAELDEANQRRALKKSKKTVDRKI